MKRQLIIKILFGYLISIILSPVMFAQEVQKREGNVTYISSQNVYVKFDNTTGIEEGDTLFISSGGSLKPAILIKHISSRSCAGELINGDNMKVNDAVVAFVSVLETPVKEQKQEISYFDSLNLSVQEIKKLKKDSQTKFESQEKYRGRFSVQSFTNLSNYDNRGEYQRWRYTLSFNGDNISNSPFSVSTYMSFAYKSQDWSNVSSNFAKSLRVYDLAVNYKLNETTNFWLGRHLNRRISNMGSVDGIQFEKKFNSISVGILAGSRPDFSNQMTLNFKLFEFGGYIGRTDSLGKSVMDNNLAVVQQTNNFETDRRFLYLQHSNNLLPNTSLFLSSEIDLYKKIRGVESTEFILTGLFLSARYAPHRAASFSLSYDARKNVFYYETYKSFIDSVYENETRHGLRFGTNIRPFDYVTLGLNAGYRFMNGDIKPSRNFNGFLTYSRVPFIEGSSTVSYTQILSNYFDGSIWGIRLSKDLSFINSDLSVTYRHTSYDLLSRRGQVIQNSLLTDLAVRIVKNLHVNLGFEGIFEEKRSSGRILLDITTRF